MDISLIQNNCIKYIERNDYKSYDLYDALTNPLLNKISKGNPLLRRVLIQINSKSPVNLHWTGMKSMVHTKTISDFLWFYAIGDEQDKSKKISFFFNWLIKLKNKNGFGWGLNFPYTSRFIDADAEMPNLYNTINSGLAICYAYEFLVGAERDQALQVINGILNFLDKELGFVDEGDRGWFLYYPGQKYPTYNVNALALYFLSFVKNLGVSLTDNLKLQTDKIIELLVDEQEEDGSWFYSRSPKGKWIDGFHSAFVIESIAFAYKSGFNSSKVKNCLDKGWEFYLREMFTAEGFPKYFKNSTRYPIEAQNMAQAIQTLSLFGTWLNKDIESQLKKTINNMINNLYDDEGYIYQKKTKYWTFKQPYIRWSITPMILALEYAKKYLKSDSI